MDRLAGVVELLDGPLDDPVALAGNLLDLARINRLTGGTRLSERAIGALAERGRVSTILDVGTGGADIPMTLIARVRSPIQPRAGGWGPLGSLADLDAGGGTRRAEV